MARIVMDGNDWEALVGAAQFKVRELARLCQMSSRQLQRDFRHKLGCTPQAWLNERKMKAAQRLLLTGDPVKKVAFDLGFKQVSHFCMWFKVANKMTPTEFVLLHIRANSVSLKHNRWR